MMNIIDSEVRLVFDEACNRKFALTHLNEGVIKDIYSSSPNIDFSLWQSSALSNEMNNSGVRGGVISGLAWKDSGLQNLNNEYVYQFCVTSDLCMKAFYMPSFKCPQKNWVRQIESLDRDIFVGIEVIPKWHEVTTRNSDFYRLLKVAEEMDLFVKVYTAHPTQQFTGNTIIETFQMIADNPANKFVIPHLGGGLPLYQLDDRHKEKLSKCLFLASTSSTMKMSKYFLDINAKNILFASDFPFNHCQGITEVIKESLALDLPHHQLNAFMYNNASEAFGLNI